MNLLESAANSIRHLSFLENKTGLWDAARPIYEAGLRIVYPRGLRRVVNGTDELFIDPRHREVSTTYEPLVWRRIMDTLKVGDTAVDVGAYIGLYTIAMAKRVGAGRVFAFEPDVENRGALERHLSLNKLEAQVVTFPHALGARREELPWAGGRSSESAITPDGSDTVRAVTLDEVFQDQQMDLLKIDVEGHEAEVLKGGASLLQDQHRRPEHVFVEVHPFAWEEPGSAGPELVDDLRRWGYTVTALDGDTSPSFDRVQWIIARVD